MLENKDILKELENSIDISDELTNKNEIKYNYKVIVGTQKIRKKFSIFSGIILLVKYSITCSIIFGILLVTTNYSAYINIAKSYILKEQVETTSKGILNSVEAFKLKEKVEEIEKTEIKEENIKEKLSIKKYKKQLESNNINLNIEITPYADRVIIPKIGRNVPLVDIKNRNIDGESELNDIFMKELEKGIIRYPGSSKPGEKGTSFIFGHSSNFPWMKGDYNDIFSTLDNVAFGDDIIVYYGQKKYIYKVREKKVITPGDVSILKRNKNKSEVTLMTCWPIGTTLNRLIVTGELVEEEIIK